MNKNKVISVDALCRLVLHPLKKLIDKKAETWDDLGDKPNVLVYDAQDLTVEQREQVKQNIGAYELQVQSDWAEVDENSPAYIKSKPEDEDAIVIATELGLVEPLVDEHNAVFTDENDCVYTA